MCDCHEHHHGDHKEHSSNNNTLMRAAIALLLFAGGFKFKLLFFIAYLIAGGDVLFKAAKNITKGRVFDENFLMSAATVGALSIREYPEAVNALYNMQQGQHRYYNKSGHFHPFHKYISLQEVQGDMPYKSEH